MVEKNKVIFNKKTYSVGGSHATVIPPELIAYLEAPEGTEIQMSGHEGKHGKYIAIWKKK